MLENWRLYRLIQLPEQQLIEYDLLFKKVAERPYLRIGLLKFKIKDIQSMPYFKWFAIKRALNNGDLIGYMCAMYGVNRWLLMLAKASDFYPARNAVISAIKFVLDRESEYLSGTTDAIWSQVEDGRLSKFGEKLRLKSIFDYYGGAYTLEQIEQWTYSRIFSELYEMHEVQEITLRYQKIKARQQTK